MVSLSVINITVYQKSTHCARIKLYQ